MPEKNKQYNKITINELNYREIYQKYYPRLILFAIAYVSVEEDAENIVQDVFLMIWENRNNLKIKDISSYLFALTKHCCIDHLRRESYIERGKQLMQERYKMEFQTMLNSLAVLDPIFSSDTDKYQIIFSAIDSLPPKCREIFIKNKIDKKSYKEIADELKISVRTVENQISNALRKLRNQLRNFF